MSKKDKFKDFKKTILEQLKKDGISLQVLDSINTKKRTTESGVTCESSKTITIKG